MRYVIGVDGGPSRTLAVLADETGCLLGIGTGGALAAGRDPEAPARARRALTDAITQAIQRADLQNARIESLCLSAYLTDSFWEHELEPLCASLLPDGHAAWTPRHQAALHAVTFGQPGVVVYAGTRACAYGLRATGETEQAGGWNLLGGDEGSAAWMALRAITLCCRAQDTIAPPTPLTLRLCRHLEVASLREITEQIASRRLTEDGLASLAEVVTREAGNGDSVAKTVVREAGKELARQTIAVLRRLDLQHMPVTVGTAGGVFRAGRPLLRTFRETVQQAAPHAQITAPRVPLACGAALIALQAADVCLTAELCANTEAAARRLLPS